MVIRVNNQTHVNGRFITNKNLTRHLFGIFGQSMNDLTEDFLLIKSFSHPLDPRNLIPLK